jgi:hypothetical protein
MSRSELDLAIDTAWHEVMVAEEPELRRHREQRWRELILQRNAQRTPAEIERLERERGLR